MQYRTSDSRDKSVMESFKTFLKDEVPQGKRNKAIRSLLWWSWSNSPDSGSITAADGDSGEYSKVTPILPSSPLLINSLNYEPAMMGSIVASYGATGVFLAW